MKTVVNGHRRGEETLVEILTYKVGQQYRGSRRSTPRLKARGLEKLGVKLSENRSVLFSSLPPLSSLRLAAERVSHRRRLLIINSAVVQHCSTTEYWLRNSLTAPTSRSWQEQALYKTESTMPHYVSAILEYGAPDRGETATLMEDKLRFHTDSWDFVR